MKRKGTIIILLSIAYTALFFITLAAVYGINMRAEEWLLWSIKPTIGVPFGICFGFVIQKHISRGKKDCPKKEDRDNGEKKRSS